MDVGPQILSYSLKAHSPEKGCRTEHLDKGQNPDKGWRSGSPAPLRLVLSEAGQGRWVCPEHLMPRKGVGLPLNGRKQIAALTWPLLV